VKPNQLWYRMETVGGSPWVLLFVLVGLAFLTRFAWHLAHQRPYALGIEAASLIFAVALVSIPAGWRLLQRIYRRYQTRGLMPHKQAGIGLGFLVVGAIYGLLFPLALAIECVVSTPSVSFSRLIIWLLIAAYCVKVAVAIGLMRTGVCLVQRSRKLRPSA